MHMGRRAKALKPTVVVNCGDPHIKIEVGKTFKTQIWLQNILRSKGIMFVALVVNLSHSAGPVSCHATGIDPVKGYAIHAPPPILDKGHFLRSCTLGVLVMINGAIAGLTTGHPF